MITEDEFKDLTDSLEVVGHYDPSVKDMLTHFKTSSIKCVGFSIFYNGGIYENVPDGISVKVTNLSEAGRFRKAIIELAEDPDKFSSLLEEMGIIIKGFKNDSSHEITLTKIPGSEHRPYILV
jgi:hypothetical protein